MAKVLTGFTKVAVIENAGNNYHYALYDDDIRAGDKVIVSGVAKGKILDVKEIISPEESKERFTKNIQEEVICKVDLTSYNNRVEQRKRKMDLKEKMDEIVAAMDEINKYSMYAANNSQLQELLKEYSNITV